MDYSEMEMMLEEMMQDPLYWQIFQIALVVAFVFVAALEVAMYILGAVGVRRLSMSAGFSHPGFAFVPILRWMMLGRLAELYLPRERRPRKILAFSVHLPILMTLSTLLRTVYSAYSAYYMFVAPDQEPADRLIALMNGVYTANSVIAMIVTVFLMLALFRIFLLVRHPSPMLATLLGSLISYCLPIFMFVCRNKPIPPQSDFGESGNDRDGDDDNGFYYDNQ